MKDRKPKGLNIKTLFWTAFVPWEIIALILGIFAFFVELFYLMFHILWVAFVGTIIGFIVFLILMPRPLAPEEEPDRNYANPKPKRPVANNRKRQRSGRK